MKHTSGRQQTACTHYTLQPKSLIRYFFSGIIWKDKVIWIDCSCSVSEWRTNRKKYKFIKMIRKKNQMNKYLTISTMKTRNPCVDFFPRIYWLVLLSGHYFLSCLSHTLLQNFVCLICFIVFGFFPNISQLKTILI